MATCRVDIQGVSTAQSLLLSKALSEIPCRVIELPEPEVIPVDNNRLITGKPSSYAARQGRRNSERVIPWEVDSKEFDPVTTDRPSGREIAVTASANLRL